MGSISKSDIDKNFGKVLREFRVRNGYTQEQLSEKLGISLKYISRIENGNNGIKTQTLVKYMNLLGITPNTIYKNLINNPEIAKNINLSEKINSLNDDKKGLVASIVDLIANFNN